MKQAETITEQRLLRMLMEFRKLRWHQPSIVGYKPSEIKVLVCIKKGKNMHGPEINVSEISKRLRVTSPTITQLLNGLEAHGLITRHIDPTDRRSISLTLTDKGELVAQQAMDMFLESMRGLINYLGEEQTNQLIDLLSTTFCYFQEKNADMAAYEHWNGEEEA